MILDPITCSGNDLAAACAEVRSRGGTVWKLETGIGGKNSMYRLSYFLSAWRNVKTQTCAVVGCFSANLYQVAQPVSMRGETAQRISDAEMPTLAGSNPAALNQLPQPMHKQNVAAGGGKRADNPKSVPDAPASISIEDRLAALQSKLMASGKIKRSKPKTESRLPYAD